MQAPTQVRAYPGQAGPPGGLGKHMAGSIMALFLRRVKEVFFGNTAWRLCRFKVECEELAESVRPIMKAMA